MLNIDRRSLRSENKTNTNNVVDRYDVVVDRIRTKLLLPPRGVKPLQNKFFVKSKQSI